MTSRSKFLLETQKTLKKIIETNAISYCIDRFVELMPNKKKKEKKQINKMQTHLRKTIYSLYFTQVLP